MLSPPATRFKLFSVSVISFTLLSSFPSVTVTDTSALILELSSFTAIILQEPEPFAVTSPFVSTAAMVSSELCHIIFFCVEFSGDISAESCFVSLTELNFSSVSETVIFSAGIISLSETSMETVERTFGLSSLTAVIIQVPALCAVMVPFWSTDATLLFDDTQLIFLLKAFSGRRFAETIYC